MPNIKLGLIGCGRIAQLVHLNSLTHIHGAELVGVAESDPVRREEARRRAPRAAIFDDYQELLKMPEVKAVVICLPPSLHAESATAAFEAGKHVYLEKPIANSTFDAILILDAWRNAGTVGMIGFNYRFSQLHKTAKQYVQSGQLGDLVCVRTVFSSAVRELPSWKKTRQSGGGALLDLASHHVDIIHFLFEEEIAEVSVNTRSQLTEDDSAVVEMRLTSGLLVQSFFSLGAVDEDRFEIYGQAGKLILDRYSTGLELTAPVFEYSRIKQLRRGLRGIVSDFKRIMGSAGEPSFRLALNAFVVAAKRGNIGIRPNLEDGYRSLVVIEAMERAAQSGKSAQPQYAHESSIAGHSRASIGD